MTARSTRLVAMLAVCCLATAGCSVVGAQPRDALTIYSGRTEDLVGPLLQRFADETGIDIDVNYGDSAELALLIDEEGERSPADVFLSQSPGAEGYLAGKGMLARLPAADLDRVDPAYRDPQGRWVGLTGRQRVLVYNQDLVDADDLPESVLDVTSGRYAGRVAVAPENGSFQDFVTAMRAVEGEAVTSRWLTALAEGGAPMYASNNAIVEAVGRGEVEMGLVNHYYNERFLAEDPSLPSRNHRFAGGDVGGLLIPSTVSILASSAHPEEARRFVRFLLDDQAQRYFAQETFEYPLAEGAQPAVDLPPLESLDTPPVDVRRLGSDLRTTVEMIGDSGLAGS